MLDENAPDGSEPIAQDPPALRPFPLEQRVPTRNQEGVAPSHAWTSNRIATHQHVPGLPIGASHGTLLETLSPGQRVAYFDFTGQYQGPGERTGWKY